MQTYVQIACKVQEAYTQKDDRRPRIQPEVNSSHALRLEQCGENKSCGKLYSRLMMSHMHK